MAGMRITPGNNSRQVLSFSTGLTLKSIKDGMVRKIDLPAGIKFTGASWSDDGKCIAFARYLDNGVELWVVDVATGQGQSPDRRPPEHGPRRRVLDARQPTSPRAS